MSYHSPIFTNKQMRRLLHNEDLTRLQLLWIKGEPAVLKGCVRWKGDIGVVFGSDFVAKVRRYKHKVNN